MEEHHFLVSLDTDYGRIDDNFKQIEGIESLCIFEGKKRHGVQYTIAISTYKRIDLLKKAIDSALNQENAPEYNIIVCDNNPERNDVTETMMEQYRDTIVTYYKHAEGLWQGGNWNRSAQLVEGKWMVLLHDDDMLMPNFMYEVDKVAKLHPDAGFIQTRKFTSDKPVKLDSEKVCSRFSLFDVVLRNKSIFTTSGMMYRKEAFMKLGGMPYDKYQAYALWFSMLLVKHFKCYYIDKDLTYYYIGTTNESTKSFLHANLIRYDYGLFRYTLKAAHVPDSIALPYLQHYVKHAENAWRTMWHSDFIFPEEISKDRYSEEECQKAVKIIRRLAAIMDVIHDYTVSQIIAKVIKKTIKKLKIC